MTVIFRMKNLSHDESMQLSFTNLKDKLEDYENDVLTK